MELYVGQLKDMNYDIEVKRSYTKKNGNTYKTYCNDILTFDIETTSCWLENGRIVGYKPGYDSEYWNSLLPLALCYIWQFSFNDKVYYGRELRDFEKVLQDIPDNYRVVIWVHNLSFEFHFLNNFLEWDSVFARSPHKPMKCVCKKYPNVEFRCSYMLTRLSLDGWGKQLGVYKATGDLDYEKIRTPLTPLTEQEMHYCEQDCIVVYNGIKEYKKRYGNIRDIPLTQTGTVRRVVKDMLTQDPLYVKELKRLIPRDTEEYKMLINIFAGGYTHASRAYSGRVVRGLIEHYDFASSYPSVMVCEKYPSDVWYQMYDSEIPRDYEFEDKAFIFHLQYKNIRCRTFNTYIQASKCDGKGFVYDNGRIIKADELDIWVTEQDYLTIRETYAYDSMEILDKYYTFKEYLPKKLIEYILDLYHNKTTLKDVEGKEELYNQSKQYINSLFGMSVTAIVQPNIVFENNEWILKPLTEEYVQEHLDKLRSTRVRERRYFLNYSWGCWVTAYARRNLWRCMETCDTEVLYCDTDSIFVLGEHNFEWYNEEVTNKHKKVCGELGLDFEKTRPLTPKGKPKPLGIFAKESNCSEFITLGAKRYVERRIDDNELHLTVSGINKGAVAMLENNIENFRNEFNFDKDSLLNGKVILDENGNNCVRKQLATYITEMPQVTFDDGYVLTYNEGINLRRNGYLLTMTDEYMRLIEYMDLKIKDLDDDVLIRIGNIF